MAVSTGTQGASATPATDLYNIISTALSGNANWTQSGVTNASMSAGDSGTTAATQTWKNTGGVATFFVNFEIDDTNARIRIRTAEDFDGFSAAAAKKIRQPAALTNASSATNTDNTSVTPTVNSSVRDTDHTWGELGTVSGSGVVGVGYAEVGAHGSGYNYFYEVRNHLLSIATRSNGVNYAMMVGEYTSLITTTTDSHPLFIFESPSGGKRMGSSATENTTNHSPHMVFSRSPQVGNVATTGPFCGQFRPVHNGNLGAVSSPGLDTAGFGASTTSKYQNNAQASQAIIHGSNTASRQPSDKLFRGYISDLFVAVMETSTEPTVGDTFIIDGVTHYYWGFSSGTAASSSATKGAHNYYSLWLKA